MGIHLFGKREHPHQPLALKDAPKAARTSAATKTERREAKKHEKDEIDRDRRAEAKQASKDARFAKKFPAAGGQIPQELQKDAPPAVKAELQTRGLPTETAPLVAMVPQPVAPAPLPAATKEALAKAKADVSTALATVEKQKGELAKLGTSLASAPPRSAEPTKLDDRFAALKLFVTAQTDRADKLITDLQERLSALEGGEAVVVVVEERAQQREEVARVVQPVADDVEALTARLEEIDSLSEAMTVTTEKLEDPEQVVASDTPAHAEAFAEVHEELVTVSHALDDAPELQTKLGTAAEAFLSRAAELAGKPVVERAVTRKVTHETATAALVQAKAKGVTDRPSLEATRDAVKKAIEEGELDLAEAKAILEGTGTSPRDRVARKWAQQYIDSGAEKELEAMKDTLAGLNGALVVIPATIKQRMVAPAVPVLGKNGELVLQNGAPVLLQTRPTLDTRWPSAWYKEQLQTAKRLGVDPYFWIAALTLELPGGYTETSFRIKADHVNDWTYGFAHWKLSSLLAGDGIADDSNVAKLARYELCRYCGYQGDAQKVLGGPPPFDPNTVSGDDYGKAMDLLEQATTASGKEFVEYGGAASGCIIGDAAFSAGVLDDLQSDIKRVATAHGAPTQTIDVDGKTLVYIEPSDDLDAAYEQSFYFLLAQQRRILPRMEKGEGLASSLQRFNGPGSIDYRTLGGGGTYSASISTSPAYGATMMAMIYAMQDPRNEGYAEIRALVQSVYGDDPAAYPIASRVAKGMKDDPYARYFGDDLSTLGTDAYVPFDRRAEQP